MSFDDRVFRDRQTYFLFAAFAVNGYASNGMAAILDPLRHELGVSPTFISLYPTTFAVALILVGLFAGWVVPRFGHRVTMTASIVLTLIGAIGLATPWVATTLLAVGLLGIGGGLRSNVVPVAFTARYGRRANAVFSEATGWASAAAVVAPFAVAAAIALAGAWRLGYVGPLLLGCLALLAWTLRLRLAEPGTVQRVASAEGKEMGPGRMRWRWMDLVLAVAIEFATMFWAATALREWHGVSEAQAPALMALYVIGMVVTRLIATPLTKGRRPSSVVLWSCAVAVAGFFIFWAAPGPVLAAIGLFISGLGVGLLAPMATARLVVAWPRSPDLAAARGTLAIGMAVGVAPFALAALASVSTLHLAYLLVPAMIVIIASHAVMVRIHNP